MHKTVAPWVVLVLVGSACVAYAVPFTNPPEDSGEAWVQPYPYQRNALIDFATDPAGWDLHWDNTEAWALDPSDNYQLFGWTDYATVGGREMWEYDWLKLDVTGGSVSWYATDPLFGSGREGVLVMQGDAVGETMSFSLEWNMANWPGGDVSHLWSEMYFAVNDTDPDADASDIIVPDGYNADGYFGYVPIGGGPWAIMNAYVAMTPSPPWQRLSLQVSVTPYDPDQPAIFMIDSWQTATEAPEPGAAALFTIGAAGLAMWWRRRRRA